MTIGWFEYGRENGAPAWYGDEIQAPRFVDLQVAGILSLFLIPTLAFLVILPGTRRLRRVTTSTFLFSMAVGATITVSIHYPAWHTGKVRTYTTYKAFSSERLHAVLGVKVGLRHVNITFSSMPEDLHNDDGASTSYPPVYLANNASNPIPLSNRTLNATSHEGQFGPPEFDYNEKFSFDDVSSMDLDRTLEKGLPYPILRVIEYLSADRTGFVWGRQYRLAGYYTSFILWFTFALWLLQLLLLVAVPKRFAHVAMLVGMMMLIADLVYAANVPHSMVVHFPGPNASQSSLSLQFSLCFYAILVAGLTSFTFGLVIWVLQRRRGYVFETFISAYLDDIYRRRYEKGVETDASHPQNTSATPTSHNEALLKYYTRKHRWKIVQRRSTKRVPFKFAELESHATMGKKREFQGTHGGSDGEESGEEVFVGWDSLVIADEAEFESEMPCTSPSRSTARSDVESV